MRVIPTGFVTAASFLLFGLSSPVDAVVCSQCSSGICEYGAQRDVCEYRHDLSDCETRPIAVCVNKPRYYDDWWDDWDDWGASGHAATPELKRGERQVVALKSYPFGGARLTGDEYRKWRDANWQQRKRTTPEDFNSVPDLDGFLAVRASIVAPYGTFKTSRTANVLYQLSPGAEPIEALDPRLVLMPTWQIDEALLRDVYAAERPLAFAVHHLANSSFRQTQGQLVAFCLEQTRLADINAGALFKRLADARANLAQTIEALSSTKRISSLDPVAQRKTIPAAANFRFVDHDVEWSINPSADLPRSVTIRYRDAAASKSGAVGVRLDLGYAKGADGEPFTFVRGVSYLTE